MREQQSNPLYFTAFDSYVTADADARGVSLEVLTTNGNFLRSSPFPIEFIHHAYEQVARLEEKMPVMFWDANTSKVHVIPAKRVSHLNIVLK